MEPLNNTPKSVLVGFDKLQIYLEKQTDTFDCIKIANNHNDKTNWRKEFNHKGGENIPALIEYLQEWSPSDAPYTWYICLFKSKVIVERLPFSKLPVTQNNYLGGVQPGMVSMEYANQLAEQTAKASLLEYQNNELIRQMQEDDSEDEEPDFVGKITEQVLPYMPQLIEGLIGMITKNKQPLQVSGVPDDATQLVEILFANGVTIEHLQKLADMAQNNKAKFKSLLFML